MGKPAWIAFAVVVVVVAGVLVWWIFHRPTPREDCSFTGWKRTIGVDLETQIQDLNAVKGKLDLNDSMIRDYDTLMKDYSLKYDSACQDVRAVPPRMTQGEYACLRQNMTRTLDQIRVFNQAVEAAKSLPDAKAQRDLVLKAFAELQRASSTSYRSGCTSSLTVNPKSVSFVGDALSSFVNVANGGNNDFTFTVADVPERLPCPPPLPQTLD